MNLTAIRPRKNDTEAQAAKEIAQRNRGAANGSFLFRDTRPVVEAVAKGLQEAIPVKPVAPAGSLQEAIQAITESVSKAVAAIATPAPKAPAAAPVQARRDNGCPPSLPTTTEAQRRRDAEAREEARKSAAAAEADRVLVTRGGGRVRVLKALDPSLSDAAVLCLNHVVTKFEDANRKPVPVNGPDLSRALGLPLGTAQAAYTELVEKGQIRPAANSIGVIQVTPSIGAAGL